MRYTDQIATVRLVDFSATVHGVTESGGDFREVTFCGRDVEGYFLADGRVSDVTCLSCLRSIKPSSALGGGPASGRPGSQRCLNRNVGSVAIRDACPAVGPRRTAASERMTVTVRPVRCEHGRESTTS